MPDTGKEGIAALRLQLQRETSSLSETFFVEPVAEEGATFVNAWIASNSSMDEYVRGASLWAPETYLQPRATQPTRLVACVEGFEGQVWNEGRLLSSRWWPKTPGTAEWNEFIDGTDIVTGLPAAKEIDWYELPNAETLSWRRDINLFNLGNDSLQRLFSPIRAAVLGLLILAIPASWLIGSYAKLTLHNDRTANAIQALSQQSEALERLRSAAYSARMLPDALDNVGDTLALIDALSAVSDAANNSRIRIELIELAGSELEVRISGADTSSIPQLIQALEATSAWKDVSAAVTRADQVSIQGRIEGVPERVSF